MQLTVQRQINQRLDRRAHFDNAIQHSRKQSKNHRDVINILKEQADINLKYGGSFQANHKTIEIEQRHMRSK